MTVLFCLAGPGGDVEAVAEVHVDTEGLPAEEVEAAVEVQEPVTVHVVVHHLVDEDVLEFGVGPFERLGVADADEGLPFPGMPVGSVDGAVGPCADFELGHLKAVMEIPLVVLGKAVLQIFDGNLHVISIYRAHLITFLLS